MANLKKTTHRYEFHALEMGLLSFIILGKTARLFMARQALTWNINK